MVVHLYSLQSRPDSARRASSKALILYGVQQHSREHSGLEVNTLLLLLKAQLPCMCGLQANSSTAKTTHVARV